MQKMKIEFYGDLTCPWSHLGWKRLSAALLRLNVSPTAHLIWRAYQLNPDIPAEGIDRTDYLLRKFGNAERVRDVLATIETAMQTEGLHTNISRIRVMSNTARAHRMMALAQHHKKAESMLQELFVAYFVMGLDISAPEILQEIANKLRLPAKETEHELTAIAPNPTILEAEERAATLGIRAVPFALFNDKYSIAGAHDAIAFTPLIELCLLESEHLAF